MTAFIPNPNYSLVRRLQNTDEQLASIFNQSFQALVDNLQLVANTLSQLTQQVNAISSSVNNLQSTYNTQLSQLQTAQNNASPVLATAAQRVSSVNGYSQSVTTALNKISSANSALTAANNNLTDVSSNAQPFNGFLNAISGLNRPNNSILRTSGAGGVAWLAAGGQSFTMEMCLVSCDRTLGTAGGSSPAGTQTTIQLNTKGFGNARNFFGLEEVNLSGNSLTVPCTGGNCVYYAFSVATFCGIGGGNSRLMLDSTVVGLGTSVQSIAGQATEANDFNQTSVGFGTFTVGSSSPLLRIESIVQANHPSASSAALGRPFGTNSNFERFASLLVLRRRML